MVIRLGGFGGLSEVHRCLSRFLAHLHICEDSVGARTQHRPTGASNRSVQPERPTDTRPGSFIEFPLKAQGHVHSGDVKDLLTSTETSTCKHRDNLQDLSRWRKHMVPSPCPPVHQTAAPHRDTVLPICPPREPIMSLYYISGKIKIQCVSHEWLEVLVYFTCEASKPNEQTVERNLSFLR